jgi:hypothetical protein
MVEPETLQKIWRLQFSCWISKDTRANAQTCTVHKHPNTLKLAHVCSYPSARSHTHTHALTHTRTHTEIYNTAFTRQQWFRERASILRYTYIICLVILCSLKLIGLRLEEEAETCSRSCNLSCV